MAFTGVPWMIGGGQAQHSAKLGRLVLHMIMGGQEGVLSAQDLKIEELATPDNGIRMAPGAVVVKHRTSGAANANQMYGDMNETEETHLVTATTADGGRSDLVIARVEDPNVAGNSWSVPDDPVHGPYISLHIRENVAPTTRSIHELGLGWSAATLARIDIPPSTSTITQNMITDLRSVVNPLTGVEPPDDGSTDEAASKVQTYVRPSENTGDELTPSDQTFTNWPAAATCDVHIPSWATMLTFDVRITNVVHNDRGIYGETRLRNTTGSLDSGPFIFDENRALTTHSRETFFLAGEMHIPASLRGTVQTFRTQARNVQEYHELGTLQADEMTLTIFEFNFRQTPSYS